MCLLLTLSFTTAMALNNVPLTLNSERSRLPSRELMDQAFNYVGHDVPDSALICFTIVANRRFAVSSRDTAEISQCAAALNGMGNLYADYYFDFQKSQEYILKALELAQRYKLVNMQVSIHNNMARFVIINYSLYPNKDVTQDSILNQFKRGFALGKPTAVKDAATRRVMAALSINMARYSIEYGKVHRVQRELQDYLALTPTDTAHKVLIARRMCQAALACQQGDYDQAISLIDSIMLRQQSVVYVETLVFAKFAALVHAGRDQQALQLMTQFEQFAKQNNRQMDLLEVYSYFLDFYQSRGNTAQADRYELLYLRQKDKVLNQYKVLDMNRQKFLSQVDQANKRADEQAYQSRIKGRMLWAIAAFALIVTTLLVMLYRKYREVQDNNRRLYLNNVQLLKADEERQALIEEQPAAKYKKNGMNQDAKSLLLDRVMGVMNTSDEIFKTDFSLNTLAELTQSSANQVSQVINELQGRNFNALLNEYRIREACRRFNDIEHYGNQTIEAIAASVGFKSRSGFSTNFKAQTGLTPSAYQRQARNAQ